MINCKNCGMTLEDGTMFCSNCGQPVQQSAPVQNSENSFQEKLEGLNNTPDTTAEFEQSDIESNKVMAILAYIIFFIPLLAAKNSKFARFHANQGLVLFIVAIVSSFVSVIPYIGYIITSIVSLAVFVLSILGIINAAGGKAKELPVIGKFKILK